MDVALLLARIALAVVFVVAAVAKLADRDGTRRAVVGFGVPERIAPPSAAVLPLAELTVAALLIPTATAWWGAVGALALLALFVAGIGVNMARGRTPDCHCFGQLYSEPIGWGTLARNAVLALPALLVIVAGRSDAGASAVAWLGHLSALEAVASGALVALAIAVAALGWLGLNLMQQNGRLLARLERLEAILAPGEEPLPSPRSQRPAPVLGLPVGSPAPAFTLPDLNGSSVSLDALRATGKPVMLLFSDPHCGPCNALLPEVGRWQEQYRDALTIALVSRGTRDENAAKRAQHGLGVVLLQSDREVSESYRAYGTPAAVIVTADGAVASGVSGGADDIRTLLAGWTNRQRPSVPAHVPSLFAQTAQIGGQPPRLLPMAARVGQRAPEIVLRDLDGHPVELSSLAGDRSLVLFWNPGCGFCQRMLPELRAWEDNPGPNPPRLIVVSTGSTDANRSLGLRSTVLLDDAFAAGQAFGAGGTPSAVLLDERGRVASSIAVGAPDVLALAHGSASSARPA